MFPTRFVPLSGRLIPPFVPARYLSDATGGVRDEWLSAGRGIQWSVVIKFL